MNLLLLEAGDFVGVDRVVLHDRRLRHMQEVHKVAVGDELRVGIIDGAMGHGRVVALDSQAAELELELDTPPPPKLPVSLVLALPRPKMLRRILQTVATLGVSRLVLINSYRVEKSFWQTPFLDASVVREQLVLGLEQARDTVLPTVEIHKRFKPYVEDHLPSLAAGTQAIVAHPGPWPDCPRHVKGPVTLAIGPEGGWIPYEVDLLRAQGFAPVQVGDRILRVETAVTALLARLF